MESRENCNKVSAANNFQLLREEIKKLQDEHEVHDLAIQQLEEQIKLLEVSCGRMIQQHLELGRAIELKKRHIAEDKRQLLKSKKCLEATNQKTNSILASISSQD